MEIKILASGSKGNCYRISDGQTPLLIECGIPWKQIQRKLDFKTSELRACLISHSHRDHSKAQADLERFGIECYAPPTTGPGEEIQLTTWTAYTFDAVHDVPCLGFVLISTETNEKLLYLSDSAYCKYTFKGLTHIMVGCNYDADLLNESIVEGTVDRGERHRLIHAHASLQTVRDMLLANDLSKVQGIWLLHLSSRNADPGYFKETIQKATGKPVYIAGEK